MTLNGGLLFFFSLLYVAGATQNSIVIFAGPQASSVKYTIKGNKQPTGYKAGLEGGVGLKVPFDNRLYFSPSLFYSMKGYTVTLHQPSFPPGSEATDNNTCIHTIEIAPLVQFDFSARPSHGLIQAGPAIDIALSGTEKFRTKQNEQVRQKMTFGFADYGRYTAAALIRLGYEKENGVYFFVHYEHGLGSLNNADGGPYITHRIAGLSCGTYIRRRKK